EPGRRVHHHLPRFCALAHDLLVDLAFGRHVDHHVALHGGLAAEPATLLQPALVLVALLHAVPGRECVVAHRYPMLGVLAIGRRDLAPGPDAAPATDRIEVHAQLPRRGQDRRAHGEAAAFARWREDDKWIG